MFQVRLSQYAGRTQESGQSISNAGVYWTMDPLASDRANAHALAAVFQVDNGSGQKHNVVIAVSDRDNKGMAEFGLACGNSWLSGLAADKEGAIKAIADGKDFKGDGRDAKAVATLAKILTANHGAVKGDETCTYLVGGAGYDRYDCPHTRHVASALALGTDPAVRRVYDSIGVSTCDAMLEKMKSTFDEAQRALSGEAGCSIAPHGAVPPEPVKKKAVPTTLTPAERLLYERREMEDELRKQGRIFSEFLMFNAVDCPKPAPYGVFGPAGWGKTFAGTTIGSCVNDKGTKLYDRMYVINVQPGCEPRDFLGSIEPTIDPKTGQKHFAQVDGPLTEAWSAAERGERVLLVVDEMNNMDEKTKKMWKSTINPVAGAYPLQTGRVQEADGRMVYSLLKAPQKNLSIYFAGNVGAGFDNPLTDPAIPSRIVESYFGPTRDQVLAVKDGDKDATRAVADGRDYIEAVARRKLKERGFTDRPAQAIGAIYDNVADLIRDSQLDILPSPRDVAWAIDGTPSEAELPFHLAVRMRNCAVRDPDGYINAEQARVATKVVAAKFGMSPDKMKFGR